MGLNSRVGSKHISIGDIISVPVFGVPGVMSASIYVNIPVQEAQVVARAVCATRWFRTGCCSMVRLNAAAIEAESI